MSQRGDVFGEVRSLLATLGPKAFAAVCAWWPEGDVPEEIITYVRDVTSRWPDMYPCMVPQAWRERVERGERVPGVRMCSSFCFEGDERALQKWAECQELSGLKSLDLDLARVRTNSGAIEQLLCHEQLSRVESLALIHGPRHLDVDRLASAQVLHGLRSLSLSKVPLAPRVLVDLLCSSHLASLESLSLRECQFSPGMWQAMAGASRLPSLASLTLQGSTLIGDEMRALLEVLPSRGITQMRFESCQFGMKGMRVLAESSKVQDLKELGLSQCHVSTEDLLTLMQSPHLVSLRRLDLSHAAFYVKEMQALVDQPSMNGVEHLVLDSCRFEQGAINALAKGKYIDALESLGLAEYSITEMEVQALLEMRLKRIHVSQRLITEEHLKAFGASGIVVGVSPYETHHVRFERPDDDDRTPLGPLEMDEPSNMLVDLRRLKSLDTLLEHRAIERVSSLTLLASRELDAFIERLMRCTRLDALRILRFIRGGSELAPLARWPVLRQIESLCMFDFQDTALLESPHLTGLVSLEAFTASMSSNVLRDLILGMPCIETLEHISLARVNMEDVVTLIEELGPRALREFSCGQMSGDANRVRRLASEYGILFEVGHDASCREFARVMTGWSPEPGRVRQSSLLKPRAMTNRLPGRSDHMDNDEVLEVPEWLRPRRTDSER